MPSDVVADTVVEGSPLLSLDLIISYFIFFLIASALIYFVIHKIRKPQNPNHIKNFFIVSLATKVLIVIIAIALMIFYLVPAPKISKITPNQENQNVSVESNIEIQFDRPVSRTDLEKKITPSIPGVWRFEVGFYKTHFYRKLVFYPDVNFLPETTYTVELNNIKNVSKISDSANHIYSFSTEPLPKITSITPAPDSKNASLQSPIEIKLDRANRDIANFEFSLSPAVPFTLSKSKDSTVYTLEPKEKLKQGSTYKVEVNRARLTKNKNGEIVFVGTKYPQTSSQFETALPANIASFTPSGDQAKTDVPLDIEFTKNIDTNQIQKTLIIDPPTKVQIIKKDGNKITISTDKLAHNTNYKLTIPKGLSSPDGTSTTEDIVIDFKTIGPVKLLSTINSAESDLAVGINNNLRFNFDQAVDKKSAQEHFSINPNIEGTLSWEHNTLIFTPNSPFAHDTNYVASFSAGIKSIDGEDSQEIFKNSFFTESYVFKLNVPAFLQQYTLSCEAATLRMILAFRGIDQSEDSLLSKIGFDPTPKRGNIWGDPHNAFVGDVKGKQMRTGYGVYWEPIERVAKQFRDAKSFTGWTINQLTSELQKGHPVQIWTYSKGGSPTTWQTPSGKQIQAVSGEHSIVAKGFVGKKEDPKQIIVNDPLIGEIYMSKEEFAKKWNSLTTSGVVVY